MIEQDQSSYTECANYYIIVDLIESIYQVCALCDPVPKMFPCPSWQNTDYTLQMQLWGSETGSQKTRWLLQQSIMGRAVYVGLAPKQLNSCQCKVKNDARPGQELVHCLAARSTTNTDGLIIGKINKAPTAKAFSERFSDEHTEEVTNTPSLESCPDDTWNSWCSFPGRWLTKEEVRYLSWIAHTDYEDTSPPSAKEEMPLTQRGGP